MVKKRGGKQREGLRMWEEMALVDDLIEWSYVVIATSGSSVGMEPDRPWSMPVYICGKGRERGRERGEKKKYIKKKTSDL